MLALSVGIGLVTKAFVQHGRAAGRDGQENQGGQPAGCWSSPASSASSRTIWTPATNAYDAFASALDDADFQKGSKALGVLGKHVEDLGPSLAGIREPGNEFLKNMLATAGVADKYSGTLANAINQSDNYKDVINNVASALEDQGLDSIDAQSAAVKLTSEYWRTRSTLPSISTRSPRTTTWRSSPRAS